MFAESEPNHPYLDALAAIFELPTMDSVTSEVSETAVEQLMPVNSGLWQGTTLRWPITNLVAYFLGERSY